jgi:hypothetical protein
MRLILAGFGIAAAMIIVGYLVTDALMRIVSAFCDKDADRGGPWFS